MLRADIMTDIYRRLTQNPFFDICDPCAACCKDGSSANVVTYSLRVLLARICPEEHSLWYGHDLAIAFPRRAERHIAREPLSEVKFVVCVDRGHRSGHAKRQRKPIAGQRVSLLLVPCPRAPKRFVPGYCDLGNS